MWIPVDPSAALYIPGSKKNISHVQSIYYHNHINQQICRGIPLGLDFGEVISSTNLKESNLSKKPCIHINLEQGLTAGWLFAKIHLSTFRYHDWVAYVPQKPSESCFSYSSMDGDVSNLGFLPDLLEIDAFKCFVIGSQWIWEHLRVNLFTLILHHFLSSFTGCWQPPRPASHRMPWRQ